MSGSLVWSERLAISWIGSLSVVSISSFTVEDVTRRPRTLTDCAASCGICFCETYTKNKTSRQLQLMDYEHLMLRDNETCSLTVWTMRHVHLLVEQWDMFLYWLDNETCSFTGWTMRHIHLLVGQWDTFTYLLDNETCLLTGWTMIHVPLLVGQRDMFAYWFDNETCSFTC